MRHIWIYILYFLYLIFLYFIFSIFFFFFIVWKWEIRHVCPEMMPIFLSYDPLSKSGSFVFAKSENDHDSDNAFKWVDNSVGKIFTLMWASQVICHRIRSAEKTQQPPITYNSFIADYKWIRRKPCVCAKPIILVLLLMMLVVITMMIIFIQSLSKCMSFVFANSPPMKTNLRATVANNVPPSPDNPRYFIKTRSPFPDNPRYFITTSWPFPDNPPY